MRKMRMMSIDELANMCGYFYHEKYGYEYEDGDFVLVEEAEVEAIEKRQDG